MNNGITTQRRHGGFTLIELMMVIVIVAILLAIALPAYQNQIIRGHRAAAKSEMLEIANRQQQFLLSDRAYASKATLTSSGYALPTDVAGRYDFDVTVGDPNDPPTFEIIFTSKGAQASDGELRLTSEGLKTPTDKWER
jgi:type IV pilus assembly protein PilE